jgi:hypothetical protein
MNQPENWDFGNFGALTLDAVRARHQPDSRFRIQKHAADRHTQFPSINSVRKTIYVLSGSLIVASEAGSETYSVQANQFIDLLPGEHLLTYPERVEWIQVLELPPQVWQNG